jgi:hypothetical protein
MGSGRYDISVDQGSTFRKTITWKDSSNTVVNLTGYTARMQVRPTYSSASATVSLTTANGGVVLGGTSGTIQLYISATATAAIPTASPSQFSDAFIGVYDLELVSPSGDVTRLLNGDFVVTPEVTR